MKRDTKGGGIITQYDGHYTPDFACSRWTSSARTLGVLSRACRNIKDRFGIEIIPEEIPTEDEKAFELMQSGNMDGLFQVEGWLYVGPVRTSPTQALLRRRGVDCFEPSGPVQSGMVQTDIKVASGKTPVHYYDDRLRPLSRKRTALWSTKSRSCRFHGHERFFGR